MVAARTEGRLRKSLVIGLLLGMAFAAPAQAASERTMTGAAIGAGAGAIVLGPLGAVAGGAVGAIVGGPRITRAKRCWTDFNGRRCR